MPIPTSFGLLQSMKTPRSTPWSRKRSGEMVAKEKQDTNLSDEGKEIPLVLELEQMIGNMIAPEEVVIMERILWWRSISMILTVNDFVL